jgi:sugar (pentulose or hexulose) kinase
MADLVIGVDASTTAVKAIAFDREGRPQSEARAGILAALGASWFGSADEAVMAMVPPLDRTIDPDPDLVATYRPMVAVYGDIYPAARTIMARLAQLGNSG